MRKNEIRIGWARPYQRKKRALSDSARRTLELAEEAVIVDPHHLHKRVTRPKGLVVDLNEAEVLITYRLEGHDLFFVDFPVLSEPR